MIKLNRGDRPLFLTDEKVSQLTTQFKKNPKSTVWKHDKIGDGLLKSSFNKCAYCECELQIKDSYMQVEHFKDKDTYPDDVVNWENLLPSCARCNRKKWTLDVITHPIVNPYEDDPRNHLSHEAFRLYAKDEKGKMTIKKLYLNDDERVIYPRFLACNEINRQLELIVNNLSDIDSTKDSLTFLLQSCQSNKAYSAFLTSTLHSNRHYLTIKTCLINNGVWDDDLEDLHKKSLLLKLDPRS
ncbi:HNH endonuclease [Acinetobacter sp. PFS20]|uniref:HNH endonuclease n=1 Tax=Acinetobacter sp. PFS20 TaxID=3458434 RepID=UPI003FCF4992